MSISTKFTRDLIHAGWKNNSVQGIQPQLTILEEYQPTLGNGPLDLHLHQTGTVREQGVLVEAGRPKGLNMVKCQLNQLSCELSCQICLVGDFG